MVVALSGIAQPGHAEATTKIDLPKACPALFNAALKGDPRLEAITPEDIQRVARRYLDSARMVTVVVRRRPDPPVRAEIKGRAGNRRPA